MITQTVPSLLIYVLAAGLEIGGCFAVWVVLRQHGSAWWLGPGLLALLLFAAALTRIEVQLAGRAYAAYGGIYILASLAWLWGVERQVPDRYDIIGGALCLLGASIILLGRHAGTS